MDGRTHGLVGVGLLGLDGLGDTRQLHDLGGLLGGWRLTLRLHLEMLGGLCVKSEMGGRLRRLELKDEDDNDEC